jgi:DNA replication protein DnaC
LETNRFDWEFETFGDKHLVSLLEDVEKWCKTPNSKKSAFTISGPTERGKTHLLKKVESLHRRFANVFPKRRQNYPEVTFVSWGKFTKETMDASNYFDLVEHSGIVLIDDFLSEFYTKPQMNTWLQIVLQKAFDILNVRVGKPTFITTNLSNKEIEALDDRVHSRLFRENGQFLEIPPSLKKFLTR